MNNSTQWLLNIAVSDYDLQKEVQYRNKFSRFSVYRDNIQVKCIIVMLFLHNNRDSGLYFIEFFGKIGWKYAKVYLKNGSLEIMAAILDSDEYKLIAQSHLTYSIK